MAEQLQTVLWRFERGRARDARETVQGLSEASRCHVSRLEERDTFLFDDT